MSRFTIPFTAKRVAVAAAIAATALSLIGCGSSSSSPATEGGTTAPAKSALEGLSADEVLAKAKEATSTQSSVHVKGEGTSDGQPLNIDLRFVRGTGGGGTFGIGGGTVDIVAKGEDVWVKGDEAFYKAAIGPQYTDAVAAIIGGKFLKSTKSDPRLGALAGIVDIQGFLNDTLTPKGAISRVDGKPVDGVATVGLKSDEGVLYVADDGSNLPLMIEQGGNDTGSLRLSEWGATFEVTPPPADQVLDASVLGQ